MGYNESSKQATIKYIKEKQERIEVKWKKDYYNNHIQPAIQNSGKPVATFIKEAVEEKIQRDQL